jgi:hypothetical protein
MPVGCEADLECGGLTPLWLAPTGRDINGWAPRQADTLRQANRSAQGSRIAESGVKPPHSKFKRSVDPDETAMRPQKPLPCKIVNPKKSCRETPERLACHHDYQLPSIAGAYTVRGPDFHPVKGRVMTSLSTFEADITPPVGHPLCAGWYPPAVAITDRLTARGLVLTGAEKPVVLCALDWAELSNREHLRWREALAAAAGTEPDRVAVQCTHTHSAPWPDRDAQNLLDEAGFPDLVMKGNWPEAARDSVAAAVKASLRAGQPCTHIATGQARVDQVASNRRIMGSDGKVKAVRWTKTKDPAVRAEPEGLIDPFLKTIVFLNGETKLAVLHFYAVHPTSFDGDGTVTPEFVGLARNRRQREDGNVPHLYFTGGGGNITAGKYNDGNPANRPVLTERIYRAMTESEAALRKRPLTTWNWRVQPVVLPPREDLDEAALLEGIRAPGATGATRSRAALMLTYLKRQDLPIPVTALHLGAEAYIVNLPGETFIEYQLAAQAERPDAFVAVAGYGDQGTGYITLERSFAEGGYEPIDSFVSGKSEAILREAIRRVLAAK